MQEDEKYELRKIIGPANPIITKKVDPHEQIQVRIQKPSLHDNKN